MTKKKNRPAGATAKRSTAHGNHETNHEIIITETGHGCKHKMRVVGIFLDPEGRWPAMPVIEMPDETPERWNAKVAEQRRYNMVRNVRYLRTLGGIAWRKSE